MTIITVSQNATVSIHFIHLSTSFIAVSDAMVYPGLGFGAMITESRKVTDSMIITAARRLASLAPALNDPDDALLPDFSDSPSVNVEIAVAVAEQAIEEGFAGVTWTKEEVRAKVKEQLWQPVYEEYVYDKNGET
jgi:malate dehydrogenase (oxaloacetate-decarboxylating)